jgi:hypothetical protein
VGYLAGLVFKELNEHCARVCAQTEALLQTMEAKLAEEEAEAARRRMARKKREPETRD